MSRSAVFVVAFAVLLAACAADDRATTAESSPSTSSTAAPSTEPGTVAPAAAATSFDPSYLSLGPGRAFPALDDPPTVPGSAAVWLEADDIVLGLVNGGEAQAFPASQMAYHHIVNTTIGGEPYLVTY